MVCVFISFSVLFTWRMGWSTGRGFGPASALELWLRDWASFGSDKPLNSGPLAAEQSTRRCCFVWPWLDRHFIIFFQNQRVHSMQSRGCVSRRICVAALFSSGYLFVWARRAPNGVMFVVSTSRLLNCEWQDVSIRGLELDFNSSSGGIIQRNVIYSLLVSLTHDLIHLTRLPWRPLKGNKKWVR